MCDLAETYQIYDYKQLPLTVVAVFSCGLRDDSRIMMKMNGQSVSLETLILAGLSDKLSILLWSKTKDGLKGVNRPTLIVDSLTAVKSQEKNEVVFNSGEDFERMRRKLIDGGED